MSGAKCVFVAIVMTATPVLAEKLTRQEIIEDGVASIRFTPDPTYGEVITDADQAAIKAELAGYAWSIDSIPEVINELPSGTKAAILGVGGLRLISADRDYCRAAMKAYVMRRVGLAYGARRLPQLNEADQKKLTELLEEVASSVRRGLIKHAGEYLTEPEIEPLIAYMLGASTAHMKNPTQESYKRIPPRERMQAIIADFESRLAAAQPRIRERAAKLLAAPGSDGEQQGRERFRSMLQSELIQPLLYKLARETSVDAAPIAQEVKRLLPGYEEAEKRLKELSEPKRKAEADRRTAAFLKKSAEDHEALMERMRSRAESGELPSTAGQGSPPSPTPSP
jgi:hypothetical protein